MVYMELVSYFKAGRLWNKSE